jgi:hypothetical protein
LSSALGSAEGLVKQRFMMFASLVALALAIAVLLADSPAPPCDDCPKETDADSFVQLGDAATETDGTD